MIILGMTAVLICTAVHAADFDDVKNHWANEYITILSQRGSVSGMDDGLFHPDDSVTTEQFVTMLIRECRGEIQSDDEKWASGYIHYALMQGIIDDYDIVNRTSFIERRSAARMIHETLLKEYHEDDESDWLGADMLSDLYDCHSCVNHIAQVYAKGIMTGRTDTLFDNYGTLTRAEAAAVIVRITDKNKRVIPQIQKNSEFAELTPDKAFTMLKNNADAVLVDVRSESAYKEGHINGSMNVPINEIKKNPYIITENRGLPIILYCVKGYNSRLAAELLNSAGYVSVYVIPGIEQYEYELVNTME